LNKRSQKRSMKYDDYLRQPLKTPLRNSPKDGIMDKGVESEKTTAFVRGGHTA